METIFRRTYKKFRLYFDSKTENMILCFSAHIESSKNHEKVSNTLRFRWKLVERLFLIFGYHKILSRVQMVKKGSNSKNHTTVKFHILHTASGRLIGAENEISAINIGVKLRSEFLNMIPVLYRLFLCVA